MTHRDYNGFLELVCHPALVVSGGRVASANARLAGLAGGELIGMRVRELVDSNERPEGSTHPPGLGLAPGVHTGGLIRKDGGRMGARFVSRFLDHGSRPRDMLVVFDETAAPPSGGGGAPGAERLLDECLRVVAAGVVVIAGNGLVALANRRCCELLGYQDLEIIGRPWASIFVRRRDRLQASEYFEKLVSGEVTLRDYCETRVPTKGGQKRVVAWQGVTLLRDASGQVQGIISSLTDLTEQKEAARASEDRERLYRLVSENATAGVWTYDIASGKVTYMSPSISQITGFSGDEVTAMGLEQILMPESRSFGVSELQRHLAEDSEYRGTPHTWTIELEQRRKDGSTVWTEVRTSVMRDDEGRPTGIFGITRDITERKQAEKTLRDSEKRYRTFFENSMDATCIIGRNGKILDVNRAALALLGYSRDEIADLNIMLNAPKEQRRAFQSQIEKQGFVRNFEMRIRRKDGVELDCVLTYDLRRDDYGNIVGYEGSIRDVTGYKRLQRNLRLYVNEVTRAQEDERLRLSRELHDGVLQNLLALGLELEKAIRVQSRGGRSQKAQLQNIRDEVQRLAKEMRAMSHALRPSVLDELGLVPAVQTLLRGLEEIRGMKTDLLVIGQESRLGAELELALFRIVQEALSNVKRHSEAGSVQVQIEFGAGSVKAVVTDDGRGFEAPKRLSDLASERRLGLAGMEERAWMLGGRVSLESRTGAGTSVMVEIPYGGSGAAGGRSRGRPGGPSVGPGQFATGGEKG
jgi:PAS domain S-box-containing protein